MSERSGSYRSTRDPLRDQSMSVARAQQMLARDLVGPHGTLDEREPGDVEVDVELLVLTHQPGRLVVGASIVGVVEGELASGAEPRAEVEDPTPEHAVACGRSHTRVVRLEPVRAALDQGPGLLATGSPAHRSR